MLLQNVMIDIETMGVGSNAAIISIGAAKFDPNALYEVTDSFYTAITLESAMAHGTITASTVEFWMGKEREDAREIMLKEEKVHITDAMLGFAEWYGPKSLPTWGNGATFDNVIVRNAMKATGVDCPWDYWDDRCFRTMKNLVPIINPVPSVEGVPHHALYDAIKQTYLLQAMLAKVRTMETAERDLQESRRIPDPIEPGTY